MKIYKILNVVFYISLVVVTVVFFLPARFKMGVYTPNILGGIAVFVAFPLSILLFIILFAYDTKKQLKNNLKKRTIIFFITVLLCLVYGFYQAWMNGNL